MRSSYLAKLLIILIGLVTVLQVITYLAARTVIRDTVIKNAVRELNIGADVFSQLMQSRAQQLMGSVTVLVDDFGFKQAVASGDAPTVQSALQNHAARVLADRAMVFDNDGRLMAGAATRQTGGDLYVSELLQRADEEGAAVATVALDGAPYQLVVATIRAPVRIGWAGMGFKIDRKLAEDMKRLTHLEISFVAGAQQQPHFLVSTLSDSNSQQFAETLKSGLSLSEKAAHPVTLDKTVMMTLVKPLTNDSNAVVAVLQIPMESILAPYHLLSQQLLWIDIASLIFAALVATLVARNLSRSVQHLATASQQIAAGNYNTHIALQTNDELGVLAHTLNQMQTAIAERESHILYQAQHDQLTGLANRSLAQKCLEESIEKARMADWHTCVIVMDLNQFKAINDSFGHGVGDQVLQTVGRRLLAAVKQQDTVVRLDGDEFLVVLDGASVEQAQQVAMRLLKCIIDPIHVAELHLVVEASFGIAAYPADGSVAEMLMRRAMIAMHNAKHSGRTFAFYQTGWDELHLRRLALVRDLKAALGNNGLSVVYQPKLSLRDPNYLGAEALVRWHHASLGPLGPDEFIPLAEQSGNITVLTRWVIEHAVKQIAEWSKAGLAVAVSVNISALDLLEKDLPAHIRALLERHHVSVDQLCLELTESSIMQEAQQSMAMLQQLKSMGIRLSIDDFGTGYSSLSQLKKMPVDELKIDKSFVLKLADSEDDIVIVRSTIELGHNMGLEVIAEGVEDESSQQMLANLGCDMVQGYLYSRPISAQDFILWAAALQEKSATQIAQS